MERAALVMQRHMSIYDTDLFKPLVLKASELSGKVYGGDESMDYALRVVAEHARAASFPDFGRGDSQQRGAGVRAASDCASGGAVRASVRVGGGVHWADGVGGD